MLNILKCFLVVSGVIAILIAALFLGNYPKNHNFIISVLYENF